MGCAGEVWKAWKVWELSRAESVWRVWDGRGSGKVECALVADGEGAEPLPFCGCASPILHRGCGCCVAPAHPPSNTPDRPACLPLSFAEDAVDVWARTFAALGIKYHDATMTLDLCDRDKKYSNGEL